MAREYRYRYKRRTDEDWEKRSSQRGNDYEGIFKNDYSAVYTIRDGENSVRILPPSQHWERTRHYGMDVWCHFNIGVNKATVICRSKMLNKRCPVCDEHANAVEAGDEKLAKDLEPRRRVVVWMIDRKDPDKGAQLWSMPWTLDRDIAKVARDRETGEIFAVDDPDEGYDVTFDREGKGVGTKYVGCQISRRSSSVPKAALRKADENPIPDTLLWRSADEIRALLEGAGANDDDDEDKPRTRRDDDDDAEDDRRSARRREEDDDEDDRRPASRRSRDEEDDDPPPRSRRRDDDDEDDRRPARRARSRDEDPDDDPPPRSRRREEPEDDDPPPRRHSRDDAEDDDAPRSRRSSRDEDDDPPRTRRRADPDGDNDPPPRRASNGRSRRDDDDEDGPPAGRFPQDEEETAPRRRSPDNERSAVAARASGLRKRFLDKRE